MKKKILIAIAACLSLTPFWMNAQDTYFPVNKGAVLEYDCYDNSNIKSGEKYYMVRYTVTDVKNTDDNFDITYMIESILTGKKEKLVLKEEDVKVKQSGDMFFFNLRDFVVMPNVKEIAPISDDHTSTGTSTTKIGKNSSLTSAVGIKLKSSYKKINIADGKVQLPVQPTLDDQIPDTNMRIEWTESTPLQLSVNIIKPFMTVDVHNFKIDAIDEEITVKAGTFSCVKITCDAKVAPFGVAIGKSNTRYTHWYAKGVGLVKMESKGVITKTMELLKISE